ncbi:MAG: hypothetical protein AAF901_00850 [Bacteroidota bacterium]
MRLIKGLGYLIIVVLLTIITQVGGLIWLISLWVAHSRRWKMRYVFPILYLICNIVIVPPLASALGRVPLPTFNENLKPRNIIYPLLFRNYVDPDLKDMLVETSKHQSINITYLDACFPFIDGFPLLPHLSHSDGKKVDISFMYLDKNKNKTDKKPSLSGYGVFANPENNRTASRCISQGHWQYDYNKYASFGTLHQLYLDKNGTRLLVKQLLSHREIQKIFLEPHIKQTLGLTNSKVRFHGCQAVRHDDHIHLQIK